MGHGSPAGPCAGRARGSSAKTTSAPGGADSRRWTWLSPSLAFKRSGVMKDVVVWERSVVPGEGSPHPAVRWGRLAAALGRAQGPSSKMPKAKCQARLFPHLKPGCPRGDTQHSTAGARGRAQRGAAPARERVGFSLCSFGLLSGMFSNLRLREEVCQRKYVTDCK